MVLIAVVLLGTGCWRPEPTAEPEPGPTIVSEPSGESAVSPARAAAGASPSRSKARQRPLAPRLAGRTVSGEPFSTDVFEGRRYVVLFFDPDAPKAAPVARGVARVARLSASHNFGVLGVAVRTDAPEARALSERLGLGFPLLDDGDGRVTRALGGLGSVEIVGVDARGRTAFRSSGFPSEPQRAEEAAEAQLREHLRIPSGETSGDRLVSFPLAPLFEARRLGGGEPFRMLDSRGRPSVVVFFLHTCPYCRAALRFLVGAVETMPEARRPRIFGIEVSGMDDAAVREGLSRHELSGFTVLRDPTWAIQQAYGVFGDVPILFFVDPKGRILARGGPGWDEASDPPLTTMHLAKIAGMRVPAFLHGTGYTGNEICGVCHVVEHAAWEQTAHAHAFDTLVAHGSDRNPECVGCHSVGFGEPGGFELDGLRSEQRRFEGVGCESCHGRGGPHLPDAEPVNDYAPTCLGCHDAVHSLGFDYARDAARTSHRRIAALAPSDLAARSDEERPLLPRGARWVGSNACRECHPSEFALWEASPHARAGARLTASHSVGSDRDADCLRCHTTGFGQPGGFPDAPGTSLAAHADLGRVGCESCHGPGGNHVGPEATRIGTILRLTEKCDSCVIARLCGSCHDAQNDPGFAFSVKEKIERQRHGSPRPKADGRIETERTLPPGDPRS